jgi:plastocyanin
MDLFHGDETAWSGPAVGENEISIHLYSFHMSPLEIKAGTTVTWINNDQADHTIVAAVKDDQGKFIPDPNKLFASDTLKSVTIASGASFSFTFDKPGEYYYLCTLHKNMVGKIIVTE